MYKIYCTYKAEDFLVDDYFVDSMLNPAEKTERFWKALIDKNKIDINEFISAYTVLKKLHENKPLVPDDRLNVIWERICKANRRKIFRIKNFRVVGYAAAICGMIAMTGLLLPTLFKPENASTASRSISDFAKENIVHHEQPADKIQIVSNNETLDIDGEQAKVEYDANGNLAVNKQPVAAPEKQTVYNQLKVPYGKRAFLKLPDGTSLWVNTGTTVIYPVTFATGEREIYVEGEIYAEVFHDAQHPFVIKTEKLDVQVLGTSFNISAYKEDRRTDIVLVSGTVNVTSKNSYNK